MQIISVRENPSYTNQAIAYFQEAWKEISPKIYEDCISHSLDAAQDLPQWYLLQKDEKIIGCTGLITNDFISRMDLYPWLCAMFIDEPYRGNNYGSLLIERAAGDAKSFGFKYLNLCTDHIGYYEKFGFTYIGEGYHPWEETSRIYQLSL